MTATLKLFATDHSDCIIDMFLFLGSTVTPKLARKQPQKSLSVPLLTSTNKTVAIFTKYTAFTNNVFQ